MRFEYLIRHVLVLLITIIPCGLLLAQNSEFNSHKNVLLLISDDHGVDQLGCYGNPVVRTPNIDQLAEQGTRFTNAYCVSASCSASRGTILSGLYPHQNGQFGHQHNWHHFSYHNWVETIPSLLKKNGYLTGLIGKLHVAPPQSLPFDFSVTGSELMDNRDVMKMAEKAAEFFDLDISRPFFLLVGYSDPHRSASGMSQMVNVENFSGFGNDINYPDTDRIEFDPESVLVPGFLPDRPEVRAELADQYQSISRLDTGIGKLLDYLRKSGRYKETLIIYISDNGIPFPGAKTNIYDSGVRLPMIIYSPDHLSHADSSDAMISFVDLLPTILDWTGSPGPEYKLPGRSFIPILNEENPEGWDEVYFSHIFHEITMYYPMRGIRTKNFKYIRNLFPELQFPFATDLFISKTWQAILENRLNSMGQRSVRGYLRRPREELYDVSVDPFESVNLVFDSEYSAILEEMRIRLKTMRQQTEDPWLINENYTENNLFFESEN